ncbi:WAP domain-containing protein [Trichonephila clavata]|uniref:WAP domain-containing protein n=1 Tax=Trichonephila clavata TaxID=2740835 RepID=A0A8X6IK34_TRICU|nr:WAP domain-containing protein [Trichonephila clavata]
MKGLNKTEKSKIAYTRSVDINYNDCNIELQIFGFCPVGDKKPDNCSISSASFLNVCKTDTDCPGTKKCCHSGCSKVCASALPVPPHQVVRKNRTPMKLG